MPDLSAQMDAVCHRFEELSVRLTSRMPLPTRHCSAN